MRGYGVLLMEYLSLPSDMLYFILPKGAFVLASNHCAERCARKHRVKTMHLGTQTSGTQAGTHEKACLGVRTDLLWR